MMFRSAVLATLAASVAAKSFIPEGDISADSKFGKRLLEKATRGLENNDSDTSWMVDYSIKYLGCSSLIQVNSEGGDGDNGSFLYTQNLVKFALCPTDESCSSCTTGDAQYVVNMMDFVDAYTEMKMDYQERQCEYVREACYCDNGDDDYYCLTTCYATAGVDNCQEAEGEEEFEVQRYLECSEMEGGNGNNNNGNNNNNNGNNNNNNNYYGNQDSGVDMYRSYWMGPSCSAQDGKSINLAVFMDAGCYTKASTGVFEAFNYGASLPYETEPLVDWTECTSCVQVDDDGNGDDNNNNYEVSELCEKSYEQSAKCESGLTVSSNYFYADTSGCAYINQILPQLSKASSQFSSGSRAGGNGGGTATAAAIIFFLTTCVLGAYSFFLYRKIHRAKVNLAQSEGMTMA